MMNIIEEAIRYREFIEAESATLEDDKASQFVKLFPSLKGNNELVKAGTRINWNGELKRAAVDLWDTEANNPDSAPTLWESVAYKDGYRIVPDTITAGMAFAKDEIGWWKEELYQSVIDANVWTPSQYPAGWKIVGGG